MLVNQVLERGALNLFYKSNPVLMEWLHSPIVYREEQEFTRQMRSLMPQYFSPAKTFYHYLHMAKGNYREYLKGEQVRYKKYLYVLRPLLAIEQLLWLKQHSSETTHGEPMPVLNDWIEQKLMKFDSLQPVKPEPSSLTPLNGLFKAYLDKNEPR